MRLRSPRRSLVVWSQSTGRAGRYRGSVLIRLARTRGIRRWLRLGLLLSVVGSMRLARAAWVQWRLLAGVLLTVAGVVMRNSPGGVVLLPGLMLVVSALLIPALPKAERMRRSRLECELAAYSTPAQRRDLEATLDRYPDRITCELRDILARQRMAAQGSGVPGGGRP